MNRVIWVALVLVLGTGIGHADAQTRKVSLEERIRDLEQANAERAAEVKQLQWERKMLNEALGSNVQQLRKEMDRLFVSSTQLPGNYYYEVTNLKTDVDRLKVQIINLQSNVSDICKISLWGQRSETLERIKEALRCREY